MRRFALSLTVVLLLAFTFANVGFAQAGKAELLGTILDPSGLPVPGASVVAQEQGTMARFTAASDDRGDYHILGLPAGEYLLTVEQPGFRTYRQSGITLRIADRIALGVSLQLGAQTESVEVRAEAPLLQTVTGEVGHIVDQARVTTLPLDGRTFVTLTTLSPGVALPNGSLLPRINGSRPRTNEYIYDGISVLQPEPGQVAFYPIIDGIQEFRLNVNSYSPEYGRSNGGTIMVSGKSGSNELHGSVFEFFRHEELNARNLFTPPGTTPVFRRNQYGFTLGGPIQKSKTFFFTDWQGSRLRTSVPRLSLVPTLAQKAGVFTTAITNPTTGEVYPANTPMPQTAWDPIGVAVLKHYPDPNLTGSTSNFSRTGVEPDNQDIFDVRLDRVLAENHRVFGRYTWFRDADTPVTPLPDGSGAIPSGVTGDALTRSDGIATSYEWTLSPSTLNQARFGYTRRSLNQASLQNSDIHVPGLPTNSFSNVLPVFAIAGFAQIGPAAGANSNFKTSVTEILDTFTTVRGRHTIKFGTDLRHQSLDILNPPNLTGAFTFNTLTGNAIASLLLGQVSNFTIDIQPETLQERANIAEFFVGDDWKVSDRLTLNLGTRYTLNFPSTEANGRGAVFNLQREVLDFVDTGRDLDCCDFAPRVGLAYRLGDSLVVRSGYGMVWFEQSGITTPFTLPQFPFIQTVTQPAPSSTRPAFVLASGPTVQVTPPNPNSGLGQGVFSTDRDHNSGYSQQWNFTVQKTIGQDWNVEVGYLGSKNTNLGINDPNINQLPDVYLSLGTALNEAVPNPFAGQIPATPALNGPTITRQQLLRPFPRFGNVALFRNNIGHSSYHALQTKVERRLSNGLTVSAAYTGSKLMDDASSVFSQTIFSGPILNQGVANANNLHLEKDFSQGDIPHVFSASWVYEIPKIWKLSGWEISGMVRFQSGDRVIVTQTTNNNSSLGYAFQRPNRLRNPNDFEDRSIQKWFDTSAFSNAPAFTLGTSSRNPVRGPAFQNADLMLGKTFALREQLGMEVRAEVFNVTNTPPLNDPIGSFGSATFGSITSAGSPRVFEFAAKLKF